MAGSGEGSRWLREHSCRTILSGDTGSGEIEGERYNGILTVRIPKSGATHAAPDRHLLR